MRFSPSSIYASFIALSFLASSSSLELKAKNNNVEAAALVGKDIAEKAKKAKIKSVVFDRGGYLYHGRVKALADAARENGLEFYILDTHFCVEDILICRFYDFEFYPVDENTDEAFEEALVSNEKDLIKVTVPVKNIGNYPGKEVVQVYVSSPVGRIDHPYQVLAGFKKTSELKPGESCEVTISFRLSELASYVESSSEFALFKGDYIIRVGNSSRLTSVKAVINLPEDVITKKVRSFFSKVDFTDYTAENFIYDEDYKDLNKSLIDTFK